MQNLSFLIIKASRQLKNSLDKKLHKYGITASQFAVLNIILRNNSKITSAEIAEALFLDRPTISGIINRLINKGVIIKLQNSKDKRSSFLIINKDYIEIINTAIQISDQLNHNLFKSFDEAEIEKFNFLLLKLLGGIENG